YSLYKGASCYVHSARGEGFGLPVAEAMLCKIPVIACNNTGLADFTNEDTALVFGYTMQPAKSHLTENSNWAEPDKEGLKKCLASFVFERETLDIGKKIEAAYNLISTKYTWDAVALRWKDFLDETIAKVKRTKVGMVTTWNTKCGIAEFTRMQMEATDHKACYTVFPDRTQSLLRDDEFYVAPRTWAQFDKGIDALIEEIKKSDVEVVELQYNFAFYSVISLGKIIDTLHKQKPVIVHLHSAKYFDDHINKSNAKYIKKTYNKAAAFIVHQNEQVEYLVKHGVKRSLIKVVPLGQLTCPAEDKMEVIRQLGISHKSPVLASYGFLLPNKGVEKTIRAVALLKKDYPDILFIASCAKFDLDISREYYDKCVETIAELGLEDNVIMVPDYLEPEQSFKLLHASDVCVMVYDQTHETSSGAVRFCAAALRPVLTTRQNIFKEFESGTLQIEDNEPESIARGLSRLLTDTALQHKLVENIKVKISQISWRNVGKGYTDIYEETANGKKKR
ncbi:MAG: glycosyltransferase, partial [Christensenellaceae bacterium]|nr:glycosyltransferase [Christensenellaceae bacterium]